MATTAEKLTDASVSWPEPQALAPDRAKQADYPVEAMGPLLAGAVLATVDQAYVPACLAAQSVLAACSLSVQAHFNVLLPTGQYRPTSLFLVSVAESGDRKSTSDDHVMASVREYENELEEQCLQEKAQALMRQSAWDEAKKATTQRLKTRGTAALEEGYRELGPRPDGPLEPTIIVRTGTTQGLLKRFVTTRPSLGLMSDEGGSWLGGYGMTEDNKLATIATLSDFWDGKIVQMMTSGEGYTALRGKRLAFHLMIQPYIAGRLLGDAEAQGQGFLSRLLVAHPDSLAGTRFVDPLRPVNAVHTRALSAFHDRVSQIIRQPLPVDEGTTVLKPRAVGLSEQARLMWWEFYNSIEARLGKDGDLQSVKGFVGKLPEMAARMAANIAVFEYGYKVQEIDCEMLSRGIRLAEFYLSEALRLFGQQSLPKAIEDAQAVSDWLRDKWSENLISLSAISKSGPSAVRNQSDYIRQIIDILVRHEHLSEQLPNGGMVSGKKARQVWRVQVRNG